MGRLDDVVYGKTVLGQLIHDLGFGKLSDRDLARKHRLDVRTVRKYRAAFKRGFAEGKALEKKTR